MWIFFRIAFALSVINSSYVTWAASQYLSQPVQLWNLSPVEVSELLSRTPLNSYRQVTPPPSRIAEAGRSEPPHLQDYETWYTPESEHQHVQAASPYGPSSTSQDDVPDEVEISQFHTQDGQGRAVFGYNTHDQVRIEARTADGKVRGSYSYLDPFGRTIKVQYWDDGFGFHATGNSIPNAADLPQPVTDTPEVQAAKRLHEQIYAKTLEALKAASPADSSDTDTNSYYNPETDRRDVQSSYGPSGESQRFEQQNVDSPTYSDLPPVYDSDGIELKRYPKLPRPSILNDPSHHHDAESESVSIDNPELSARTAYGNYFRQKRQSEEIDDEKSDRNGFFYSFRYPAPLLVNVQTHQDEVRVPGAGLSVSQRASLIGAIPASAVHDVQLAPGQVDPIKGYSERNVYTDPHQLKRSA